MTSAAPTIRIGISGWRYESWRGSFYPAGLAQRRELEFAARQFDSIELNGSFYALQRPEHYRRWRDETPAGFVFAVKGPRFITHMLRLRHTRVALANFFASGVLDLDDKLGPVLWQLPERQAFDSGLVEDFIASLPHTRAEAVTLAAAHDDKVAGRTHFVVGEDRPLRHAIEVRSATFEDERFYEQLRRHGIGLVAADTAGRWPLFTQVTAGFVYVRLHGAVTLYASGYTDELIDQWARRIDGWRSGASCPDGRGRDVYVYFDNDAEAHAPFDALSLRARLGANPAETIGTP